MPNIRKICYNTNMLKNFDKVNTDGIQIVSNFHTHNYLCGHAYGTVTDYVKQAVDHSYKAIGISDHFASHCDINSPYITFDTLETEYLTQFEKAEAKYGNKITILKGVEVAYYEGADGYYRKLRDKLDYLVMGQHGYMLNGVRKNSFFDGNDEQNIIAYCQHCIKGLKTGLFTVFAHPDVIFYCYDNLTQGIKDAFDDMICAAAQQDVIVELNANGIRNAQFSYPTDLLVDCCIKYNAKVIISSDCHLPEELYDEYVLKLYAYAKRRGLRVLDDIRNNI